jgi:hypothetical protein
MYVEYDEWIEYCRDYAQWAYGYRDLADDFTDRLSSYFSEGASVLEAVDAIAEKYDLEEIDPGYRSKCPFGGGMDELDAVNIETAWESDYTDESVDADADEDEPFDDDEEEAAA